MLFETILLALTASLMPTSSANLKTKRDTGTTSGLETVFLRPPSPLQPSSYDSLIGRPYAQPTTTSTPTYTTVTHRPMYEPPPRYGSDNGHHSAPTYPPPTYTTPKPTYQAPATYNNPEIVVLQPVVNGYGTTIGYLIPAALVRTDGPTILTIVPKFTPYGTQQQQAETEFVAIPSHFTPNPPTSYNDGVH